MGAKPRCNTMSYAVWKTDNTEDGILEGREAHPARVTGAVHMRVRIPRCLDRSHYMAPHAQPIDRVASGHVLYRSTLGPEEKADVPFLERRQGIPVPLRKLQASTVLSQG